MLALRCALLASVLLGSSVAEAGLGSLVRGVAKVARVASKTGKGLAGAGKAARLARVGKAGGLLGKAGALAAGEAALQAFRLLPADEAGRAAAYLTRAEGTAWRLIPESGTGQLLQGDAVPAALDGIAGSRGTRLVLSPSAAMDTRVLDGLTDTRSTVFVEDLSGDLHRARATSEGWRVDPKKVVEGALDGAELGLTLADFTLQQLGQPDDAVSDDRPLTLVFTGVAGCPALPAPELAGRAPPLGPEQGVHDWLLSAEDAHVLVISGTAVELRSHAATATMAGADMTGVQLADPCDAAALLDLVRSIEAQVQAGVVLPLADRIGASLGEAAVRSQVPLEALALGPPEAAVQAVVWVRQVDEGPGPEDPHEPPAWVLGLGLVLGVLVAAGVGIWGRITAGRGPEDADPPTAAPD